MKAAITIILLSFIAVSLGLSYVIQRTVISDQFLNQKDNELKIDARLELYNRGKALGNNDVFKRDSTQSAILTSNLVNHLAPEAKDLSKAFLTILVAVLVASITFAEKIVNYKDARTWNKAWITSSWITFMMSILCCGIGIVYLMIMEGYALNFTGIDQATDPFTFANPFMEPAYTKALNKSAFWFSAAGFQFCCGLVGIIVSAIIFIYPNAPVPPAPVDPAILSAKPSDK